VQNKIAHLEKQVKRAYDLANNETGSGIKEGDEGTFKALILQRCHYYFDLEEIMGDHSGTGPNLIQMKD
jgi:hypothetical protein